MTKDAFKRHVIEMEDESNGILDRLKLKPVVVIPAGRLCILVVRYLIDLNVNVIAVGDGNPEHCINKGKTIGYKEKHFEIEKTADLARKYQNDVNYVIYANLFREEIIKELLEEGVDSDNIYQAPVVLGDLVPRKLSDRIECIDNHFEDIQMASDMLSDDLSKREYWDVLTAFCVSSPIWMIKEMSEEYFNTPYIRFGEGEVYVDAGVFDGESIRRFAEICPVYKAIYGIEANPNNITMINNRLTGYRNIKIYNNALANKNGELRFKRNGLGIEGARLSEDGEIVVPGLIGDELEIDPTFIKFDIEGAEWDALQGFKKTIKRCKPNMAISVYHSLEDHWRLIKLVKSLCSEYKLYYKHHYGYGIMYGTVLYACV